MTDTGPGIPGPDLDRIFDPFERLGAEQTAIEGTGIGLPLARAFAEAMEGHLTAASIPGEGTTFTVTLPRAADMVPAADDDRASVPVPRTGTEDPAGTDLDVLYIEDNPANIEVVSRFLRTRPAVRLQSVTSGQAGLALAAQEIPDLILLDLHLPGLHGHEVLRRLKEDPATAGIPVAILSAEAAPAVIRHMRAAGVIAYLTKPLDLAELGQLIDSFAAELEHEAGPAPRRAPAP
jgi:CheY-like chemotaxis protein